MRTELVPASVGQPKKRFDLVQINRTSGAPPILGQPQADFFFHLQHGEGVGFSGLQGMMHACDAYRATEKARRALMQSRRKHRLDMLV